MKHDGISLYWSSSAVDIILVFIAVSYTATAIGLYLRISRSMSHSQLPAGGGASLTDGGGGGGGDAYQPLPEAAGSGDATPTLVAPPRLLRASPIPRGGSESTPLILSAPPPAAAAADGEADAPGAAPTLRQLRDPAVVASLVEDIRTAEGLAAFRKSIRSVMSRSLYTEASRRELRGALSVFSASARRPPPPPPPPPRLPPSPPPPGAVAVMLSSALLILVRAVLSLAFSGDAEDLWWFQLFVTWLPDVPPWCVLEQPRRGRLSRHRPTCSPPPPHSPVSHTSC